MSAVLAPVDYRTRIQQYDRRDSVATFTRGSARRRLVQYSAHALLRAAQRHVVPDAVDYVIAHGTCCHRTGIMFFS